jgi:uncharacterized membrane protein
MKTPMTKEHFIETLKNRLNHLPPAEREEILLDQEEYIRDAMASGRSEEEVVHSLGSPEAFADSIPVKLKIEKAEKASGLTDQMRSTLKATLAVIALTPFNLFIVLGPFVTAVSLLGSGFFAGAALTGGSVIGLFAFLFHYLILKSGWALNLSAFFLILGLIAGGVAFLLFMTILTRTFIQLTLRYLRWNLKLIKKASI